MGKQIPEITPNFLIAIDDGTGNGKTLADHIIEARVDGKEKFSLHEFCREYGIEFAVWVLSRLDLNVYHKTWTEEDIQAAVSYFIRAFGNRLAYPPGHVSLEGYLVTRNANLQLSLNVQGVTQCRKVLESWRDSPALHVRAPKKHAVALLSALDGIVTALENYGFHSLATLYEILLAIKPFAEIDSYPATKAMYDTLAQTAESFVWKDEEYPSECWLASQAERMAERICPGPKQTSPKKEAHIRITPPSGDSRWSRIALGKCWVCLEEARDKSANLCWHGISIPQSVYGPKMSFEDLCMLASKWEDRLFSE